MAAETVMVASTLDRLSAGQALDKLPPHMTYMAWFELPDNEREAFVSLVQEITEEYRPPRPQVGDPEKFGNDERGFTHVRRLDGLVAGFNPILDFQPHAALHGFVSHVDPQFDDTYFGVVWHPHTESLESSPLIEGDVIAIDNLTIFRKDQTLGKKVVEAVYPWERP